MAVALKNLEYKLDLKNAELLKQKLVSGNSKGLLIGTAVEGLAGLIGLKEGTDYGSFDRLYHILRRQVEIDYGGWGFTGTLDGLAGWPIKIIGIEEDPNLEILKSYLAKAQFPAKVAGTIIGVAVGSALSILIQYLIERKSWKELNEAIKHYNSVLKDLDKLSLGVSIKAELPTDVLVKVQEAILNAYLPELEEKKSKLRGYLENIVSKLKRARLFRVGE